MKTKRFAASYLDGWTSVMDCKGLNVHEIRFNRKSRNIDVVYGELIKFEKDKLDAMHHATIKKLVLANEGTYTDKEAGVAYLLSL